MANEIYKRSWWGDGWKTNTIGWGSVMMPKNEDYIRRVLEDGGTLEALECQINLQ